MRTWFNVGEAAEYAGVSRDTIYTAVERHELHHARIGGRRSIRIRRDWVDAWLERHAQAATASRAEMRGVSEHGTGHANASVKEARR